MAAQVLRYDPDLLQDVAALPPSFLRYLSIHKLGHLSCALAATGLRHRPSLDRLAGRAILKIRRAMVTLSAEQAARQQAFAAERVASMRLPRGSASVLQLSSRRESRPADVEEPLVGGAAAEVAETASHGLESSTSQPLNRSINLTGLASLAIGFARLGYAHSKLFSTIAVAAAAVLRSNLGQLRSKRHGALISGLPWAFVSLGMYHRRVPGRAPFIWNLKRD